MQNNVNSNISWYEGHTITSLGKILKNLKFYVQNIWQVVRWWHHQLTHLHIYSYRLVKKCFVKICETSKCHNFLIFQPIFIRFSLLCLEIFTLSSEIKLNLLWSSSLKEKLPQTFMHIGWMEDDFRNLTAKVWANLDNSIKRYDFSKASLILCMSPSRVALF